MIVSPLRLASNLFWRRTKKEVPPYSVLSQIYDQVMSHVDYERWANYIAQIAARHGNGGNRVLDLSCGTGSFCAKLGEMGFTVFGCDLSLAMVRRARRKFVSSGSPIWCADLKYLALKTKADLVVSLYDSMNYLIQPLDWTICLNNVHGALADKGLFIFDVSTVYNSLHAFHHLVQRARCDGGRYVRRIYFDEERMLQHNDFEVYLDDPADTLYIERHRQRIRTLNEIDALIRTSPFRQIDRYSDFTFHPGAESAERVHYVLRM